MKHLAALFLLLLILGSATFAVITCGTFANTVAERKINENSFQYQEARKTELLRMEAQLRTLNSQLENLDLTEAKKNMLNAQKSNLEQEIEVTKGKLK